MSELGAPFEAARAMQRLLGNAGSELWLRRVMMLLLCLWMLVVVILPIAQLLSKSFTDETGAFVGLANFIYYFKTPALSSSISHSMFVATVTTMVSVGLGFLYAYALTRTKIPGKEFLRGLAMVPLFSPTLLNGIALVYLFGRKGLITRGFFGTLPGWDIGLYGPIGIILAEVFFTFPQAMLILSIALRVSDARLYEASESLGASKLRTFFTVTVPCIKYNLISSFFVCFILTFTDFGAPKVVGGNYNVLSTDIYKQVIGQQNFVMGAVVSVILLIPTVAAFILDRLAQRKQVAMIAAKSVPLMPKRHPARDWFFIAFCGSTGLVILGFFATAVFASLVKVWPYDLSLGLWNYDFKGTGGGGYAAFFNSIRMSFYSAAIGAILTFSSAYLIEKGRGLKLLRQGAYFLSMIPLALPGLVIGLAYIFFFNAKGWGIFGL